MPYFDSRTTGLVGTVGVTILDSAGAVHIARTTAGITEPVASSGMYFVAEHDATATLTYVWDVGVGTTTACETLYAGRQGDAYAEAVLVHAHVGTIDGHITADYTATEKSAIDLLDDVAGGLADIHTDVGTAITNIGTVDTVVDGIESHVHTIDGHITADYAATEKAAIDLLDDAIGGLLDVHTDVAAVKAETALIVADTDELQAELADGGRTDLILDGISGVVTQGVPENVVAYGQVLTKPASAVTGSWATTDLNNAAYLETQNTATGTDVALLFHCAAKRAGKVTINGRWTAATGRFVNVFAWNYLTGAYDQLSDNLTRMNHSSSDLDYSYQLLSVHQKNYADGDGEVKIRFASPVTDTSTSYRLFIDQVLVQATSAAATASDVAEAVATRLVNHLYEHGVWIDTVVGGTGTPGQVLGLNGTPNNPVDNYADAYALAGMLGVKRFYLRPDSTIELLHNHDYWRFIGRANIDLSGESIVDAIFEDAESITGVGVGGDAFFRDCQMGTVTLDSCIMRDCLLTSTLTTIEDGLYTLINCSDGLPGTGNNPDVVFAANVGLAARYWSGGIELKGVTNGCFVAVGGLGRVVINADCTGGQIVVRGNVDITDQGGVPGTFDALANGSLVDTARWNEDQTLTAIEADTSAILAALPTTSYRFLIKT